MQEVMPTTVPSQDRPMIEVKMPVADIGMSCDGVLVDTQAPIDNEPLPTAESLKAARSILLAEYGPCVASHTQTLVATARRLEASSKSV